MNQEDCKQLPAYQTGHSLHEDMAQVVEDCLLNGRHEQLAQETLNVPDTVSPEA